VFGPGIKREEEGFFPALRSICRMAF